MNNCIDRAQLEARSHSRKMREFLDNVDVKWYVETEADKDGKVQNGNVTGVLRDRFGIAVCLELEGGTEDVDYISADRVSFWEPWDYYFANPDDYEDLEDVERKLRDLGYSPSEQDPDIWVNKETGDEYWFNGGAFAW